MACDLRCPDCGDNLGKDTENTCDARCGTCGESFFNERGYIIDTLHLAEVKKLYPNKRLPKPEQE